MGYLGCKTGKAGPDTEEKCQSDDPTLFLYKKLLCIFRTELVIPSRIPL